MASISFVYYFLFFSVFAGFVFGTENTDGGSTFKEQDKEWDAKRIAYCASKLAAGAAVGVGGAVAALPVLGFAAGPIAAAGQAIIGNVAAGSWFAYATSAGAAGMTATTKAAIGTAAASVVSYVC